MTRVWLVVVCGCNQAFGLHEVSERDPRLLAPPPASACPAPPDFASWHYAPKTIAGVPIVLHPTFLTPDEVVFMSQQKLFYSTLDGPAEKIAELDAGDGADQTNASAGPGGKVFWYDRIAGLSGGTHYATRDASGAWTKHTASFDNLAGYGFQVGPVGFYDGTVRMVAAVAATASSGYRLVELQSDDALVWIPLDTIAFAPTNNRSGNDPALSNDGCVLLFERDQAAIELALRQPDGTFGDPVELFTAATPDDTMAQPTLDPTQTRLWYVATTQLIEGTP